jgi:Fe2+ or Zn2+ uptake regulation protein
LEEKVEVLKQLLEQENEEKEELERKVRNMAIGLLTVYRNLHFSSN